MEPLKNPDAPIQARFERHRFLGALAQVAPQLRRVQGRSLQLVGELVERSPDAFVGGPGVMSASESPGPVHEAP